MSSFGQTHSLAVKSPQTFSCSYCGRMGSDTELNPPPHPPSPDHIHTDEPWGHPASFFSCSDHQMWIHQVFNNQLSCPPDIFTSSSFLTRVTDTPACTGSGTRLERPFQPGRHRRAYCESAEVFGVVHFCSWTGVQGGISLCILARDAKENAPSKEPAVHHWRLIASLVGPEEACAHE